MATIKSAVEKLNKAHNDLRTWRAVSAQLERETGIHVPAGTLCYIVKMDGAYTPTNRLYLAALGLRRKAQPRAPRSLFDMSARSLRWALDNRESF
jgi:hypothetical protein